MDDLDNARVTIFLQWFRHGLSLIIFVNPLEHDVMNVHSENWGMGERGEEGLKEGLKEGLMREGKDSGGKGRRTHTMFAMVHGNHRYNWDVESILW